MGGEIEYTLISDDFEEIEDLQEKLLNATFADSINEDIQKIYPEVIINEIEASPEGIEVEISVTVDTTDASENLINANKEIEKELTETFGFEEPEANNVFITSMPTALPTKVPSLEPTTTMPTSRPSITGLV